VKRARTRQQEGAPAPAHAAPELAARLEALTKTYALESGDVHALRSVSLDVPRGDYIAIMGPSGSGKTTLLNILGCLDRPSSGRYFLGDDEVSALGDGRLSEIRGARVGFIFQQFNLVPELTLLENIQLPLYYRGRVTSADKKRCRELGELVGLGARLGHRPTQLSGGQQQRGAIARSLVNDPTILLADEPTGNLDSATTVEILALIDRLNEAGKTVIVVTHDPDVAARARRTVRVRDGEIVADERTRALDAPLGAEQ
jgi:putative ABC transport system ATP-binding protein